MRGPFGHALEEIPAERIRAFWSKVDDAGKCWRWTGNLDAGGYGVFKVGSSMVRAHRASWVIANGPLAAGELVLHRCDNRRCVKPAHLFVGVQRDNVADMVAKGRHGRGYRVSIRGEDHHAAKISNEQVEAVKVLRAAGWSQRRVGSLIGISHTHVGLIEQGRLRAG